jgi:hypothetical protein
MKLPASFVIKYKLSFLFAIIYASQIILSILVKPTLFLGSVKPILSILFYAFGGFSWYISAWVFKQKYLFCFIKNLFILKLSKIYIYL